MARYIQSAERKTTATKNTLPGKVVLQNWSRDKEFSKQAKAERIYHHWISLTWNVEVTSSSWNKGHQLITGKHMKI